MKTQIKTQTNAQTNTKTLLKRSIMIGIAGLLMVSCGGGSGNSSGDDDSGDNGATTGNAFAPWADHPGIETSGSKDFAFLINNYAEGRPTHDPWDSTYFPYTSNGTAAASADGGGSAMGKYDAAHGNTTHAQEWELQNHGPKVPHVAGWWGHCNGWSSTASLFKEPNPEGKTVNGVHFTEGDIKALLTEAGMMSSADYFGEKVDPLGGDDPNDPNWQDVAPDQYFLVLTNYMGAKKIGMVVDRYTGNEIWNQPVAGYRIQYPKPSDYLGQIRDGVYGIKVTSTLWWADDSFQPDIETPPFNWEENANYPSRTLNMDVWLDGPVVFDANGKITSAGNVIVTRHPNGKNFVGGVWHDEDMGVQGHPDFIWVPYSLLDARDPELNHPDDPNANIYIDYQWIVDHFINDAPDDPGVHGTVPSPPPASPGPNHTPDPGETHNPFPWPTHTHGGDGNPDPGPIVNPDPGPNPIPIPIPGGGNGSGTGGSGNGGSGSGSDSGSGSGSNSGGGGSGGGSSSGGGHHHLQW